MAPRLSVDDLPLVRLIGHADLSPHGTMAAYVDAGYDLDGNRSTWAVWVVPTDGSAAPRQLTNGRRDSRPAWSPDGRLLAYLAADRVEWRTDIVVVDAGTGAEVGRVVLPRGVEAFAWSPDGEGFAATGRPDWPDDPLRPAAPDAEERRRRYQSRVIHVTRARYRGYDYWEDDEQPQLWWCPLDGDPRVVVEAVGPITDPGFAPDGRITFVGCRTPDWHTHELSRIWAVAREGGEPQPLTDDVAELRGYAFTAAGELVWVGQPGGDVTFGSHDPRLYVDGKDVSEPLDRPASRASEVQSLTLDYLAATFGPQRGGDGAVYVHVVDAGCAHVYRYADGELSPFLTGRRLIGDFRVAGDVVLFTATSGEVCNGLFVRPLGGGEERLLVDPNPWLADREFGEVRHLGVPVDDGAFVMDTWAVLPAGWDGTPLPTILEIHAGPHSSFPWDFHLEHRMWANQGFAVVVCNQVGSQGYGEEFAARLDGHWGEADLPHYLAAVDAVVDAGVADATRVGVTGLTYGAMAALWCAAHTDRFRAVVTNRAMTDLTAMYADCDIGSDFLPALLGAQPWEDPELYRRLSPVTYATQITAPTRLLAFDGNGRTTVAASEAIYRRLRKLGVETDMLVFPRGAATVFHPNQPWSKLRMMQATLEWFARHL